MQGDCRTALAGVGAPVDLVVADPPYNEGVPYDAYSDNKSYDEYMAFTRAWLGAAAAALGPHGSLFVFAPDEWDDEVRLVLKKELKLHFRRKIVWAFTFGQAARRNFTRSHCNVLYFTKSRTRFTFNEDAVRVPSARQLVYGDRRASARGKLPDDVWVLLADQLAPCMTPDRDTWLQSRVCGTFRERRRHSPNQLPLPLVERIVAAASPPGGLVADPFLGTGTTAEAALRLGRRFWGCDLGARCVTETTVRLATAGLIGPGEGVAK